MAHDLASLDAPFATLSAFDWGADPAFLKAIDAAVVAAHADAALRADLEKRLTGILTAASTRAAKEYACRKLAVIGTAASVPALAALLPQKDHSHMARFALERIAGPEAGDALRRAFAAVDGELKLGMLSSLAARHDAASVPLITPLLSQPEPMAVAAAVALGSIRGSAAAQALATASGTGSPATARAIADARLACAEGLLAAGDRTAALAAYRAIADTATAAVAKPILLAAQRGILACLDTSSS